VRLTIVGSAAAWARGPDEPSSCYLVEGDEGAIVLDLGQGSFGTLRARRRPETLAAVFVSHLHPDHCVDLIALRHYLRYEAAAAPGTIELHAPAGLPERFDALFGEPRFLADLPFTPLVPRQVVTGGLRVTIAPVTHTDASFAFRVSSAVEAAGAGLVYSGDCGVARDLLPLLRPGDTLLVEASFGSGPVPPGALHLDAPGIAEIVRESRPGQVLLTHIQMGFDPAAAADVVRGATAAPVCVVEPGERVTI